MIGKRIAELRKEKGMTQEELAKALNITRSALSLYEIGKRDPDTETVKKLADFFGVSIDYLMGKSNIRNPYNEFLAQAKEKYGSRGKKQAEELLENIQSLFNGGELPEEDKDEFFRAITEIYFEAKEKNKKYTPKKYKNPNSR